MMKNVDMKTRSLTQLEMFSPLLHTINASDRYRKPEHEVDRDVVTFKTTYSDLSFEALLDLVSVYSDET
jgi:hypothetical protein